jgi:hypothetical protein
VEAVQAAGAVYPPSGEQIRRARIRRNAAGAATVEHPAGTRRRMRRARARRRMWRARPQRRGDPRRGDPRRARPPLRPTADPIGAPSPPSGERDFSFVFSPPSFLFLLQVVDNGAVADGGSGGGGVVEAVVVVLHAVAVVTGGGRRGGSGGSGGQGGGGGGQGGRLGDFFCEIVFAES